MLFFKSISYIHLFGLCVVLPILLLWLLVYLYIYICVTDVIKLSTDDYKKECVVQVVDDQRFESTEDFRLVLGSPYSQRFGQAKIGVNNSTVIHIQDEGDREYCLIV